MTFWQYLDRWDERRAHRHPRDIRQFIGFMFLAGYYVMVYRFATGDVPQGNLDLIRDAMLTLGPPVGLIVGAMFRSDAREDQRVENTAAAFRAVEAAATAGTSNTITDAAEGGQAVADEAQDAADKLKPPKKR